MRASTPPRVGPARKARERAGQATARRASGNWAALAGHAEREGPVQGSCHGGLRPQLKWSAGAAAGGPAEGPPVQTAGWPLRPWRPASHADRQHETHLRCPPRRRAPPTATSAPRGGERPPRRRAPAAAGSAPRAASAPRGGARLPRARAPPAAAPAPPRRRPPPVAARALRGGARPRGGEPLTAASAPCGGDRPPRRRRATSQGRFPPIRADSAREGRPCAPKCSSPVVASVRHCLWPVFARTRLCSPPAFDGARKFSPEFALIRPNSP